MDAARDSRRFPPTAASRAPPRRTSRAPWRFPLTSRSPALAPTSTVADPTPLKKGTSLYSRRHHLAALLGLTAGTALSLTGCSASTSSTSSGSASASATPGLLPDAEGATTYPLTLTSPFGATTLTARPERIAAVTPTASDTELLLSLGVTPILSSSLVSEGGYLATHGGDTVPTYEFGMGDTIPVEAIAASKPDLIVAVGWTDGLGGVNLADYYDQLSAIAPAVGSPDTSSQVLVPWEDSIRIMGETLDLSDAAEAVISSYEQTFATLRDQHPELAGVTTSWAIFYCQKNGLH